MPRINVTSVVDDEGGIPATSFAVDDVTAAYRELDARGVRLNQEPTAMGPYVTALLEGTGGNVIQLASWA